MQNPESPSPDHLPADSINQIKSMFQTLQSSIEVKFTSIKRKLKDIEVCMTKVEDKHQ